ncbi:C6 transcription factor [Hirsutella rhossiliensis]|uniref:C6 transcription factor n=1 Tax=Hirsutella rhossiliensis TaxID=111463 RepID=A0A9P8SFQ5_9HYPO|nr:C6 transcription factor [Hirsutella rhossiliensis]KAH0959675.1 C6 transcription factor [Hirsutella rhossiliensis]
MFECVGRSLSLSNGIGGFHRGLEGEECVYGAAEGETVLLSLKKKHGALEGENGKYKELLTLLRTKPDDEAHEILRRIRSADEPLLVLVEIRHAELLLAEPSPTSERASHDDRLLRLDQEAHDSSVIKVPAKPWTVVADDGLVSELITEYFTWDHAYLLPSVDRDVFLQEMRGRDPSTARWCSPLLVNAICAHKSQVVERARLFGAMTRQDMTERFLYEAKSLLYCEQGRASIPTAQALMLMFLTTTCLGRDRAGRIYRHHAIDMIQRLKIEAKYTALLEDSHDDPRERRLLAKALWGLFVFESRSSFFYFEPSQIPPPRIPQPFTEGESSQHRPCGNIDVLGRPFEESPCLVPHVPGINAAACSLSELFYEIMTHNVSDDTAWGGETDLRIQKRLYSRLKRMTEAWPRRFYVENNVSPGTCFLRMHENEVGFGIVQVTRHEALFETPASQPGTTIGDLCLHHCSSVSKTIEAYLARWPFDSLLWRHLYLSMQPLVLMFDNPIAVDIFTKNCMMMRYGCRTFRVCGHLIQATQAFAWAINQPIPDSALPYLEGWTREEANGEDLPVSFALPQQDDVKDLLAANLAGTDNEEDQLGALLKRWALE